MPTLALLKPKSAVCGNSYNSNSSILFILALEMESVEAALRRAEHIDTMGALLDTNTVAYYQYELPDRKLFVNGFFERVKKVLMLIPKEDAASGLVSDYISCIENNLSHSLENEINSLKVIHSKP